MASIPSRFRRSRMFLIGLIVLALVGTTTAVVAAVVATNNGPFTGCLSKFGVVYNVKAGASPKAACAKGDTQIAFSNGQGVPIADPCAAKIGTYLETGALPVFGDQGQPLTDAAFGRVISLFAGSGMSVVNADNSPASSKERQSDSQGTWSCTGNTVTGRTLDYYRAEAGAYVGSPEIFEVDRIDWTATFAAPGTLTGTLTYCSWTVPVPASIVQANACDEAATSHPATFKLTRNFRRPVSPSRAVPDIGRPGSIADRGVRPF